MADPVIVKPVTPDQPRQEAPPQKGQGQGRPRPGAKAGPPVDPEKAPITELARKAELSLAEPDLGGRIHVTV